MIVHEEPRDDGFVERRSIQVNLQEQDSRFQSSPRPDDGMIPYPSLSSSLKPLQIGLFSSSFIPCVPDNPSTYVNLDRYTRWISDNVGELEDPATE